MFYRLVLMKVDGHVMNKLHEYIQNGRCIYNGFNQQRPVLGPLIYIVNISYLHIIRLFQLVPCATVATQDFKLSTDDEQPPTSFKEENSRPPPSHNL